MNEASQPRTKSGLSDVSLVLFAILICLSCITDGFGAENKPKITPPFDVQVEDVLLSPSHRPRPILSRGTWRKTKDGLRPPQKGSSTYLFARIKDGTIRIRFQKKELRTRLVFRAHLSKDKRRIKRAYALRFDGPYLWLEEINGQQRKQISNRIKLWRFWRTGQVELTVSLIGPTVDVQIYDRRNEERRGSFYVTGLDIEDGSFGFMHLSNDKPPRSIELVSHRPACRPVGIAPQGHYVIAGFRVPEGAGSLPAHSQRLETRAVPEDCAGADCFAEQIIRTDPAGLEDLRCRRDSLVRAISKPAWRYLDDEYRHSEKQSRVPGLPDALKYQLPSPRQVNQLVKAWHKQFPKRTKLRHIGTSIEGREILALAIGSDVRNPRGRPQLLFNGAHHGDEVMTVLATLDIIENLLTSQHPDDAKQMDHFVTWVVPLVNPDGLSHYLNKSIARGRKNGRPPPGEIDTKKTGVDLNRNYPFRWGSLGEKGSKSNAGSSYYRGADAASEPETKALIQLADQEPFMASISYHTGTIAVLSPYTIDRVRNPRKDEAWAVAEELVQTLPKRLQRRRPKVKRNLYSVDGVDQDWHRHTHGTLALLLEIARYAPRSIADRKTLLDQLRPAWRFLASRFLKGPSVTVKVLNREGRPTAREVRIDGMQPPNGEKWMSRCPGGHYFRYLPKPGTYTIRVRDKSKELKRRIKVGTEHKEIKIHLDDESQDPDQCTAQ